MSESQKAEVIAELYAIRMADTVAQYGTPEWYTAYNSFYKERHEQLIPPVKQLFTRDEVKALMSKALNLGMTVRQNQLNHIERRSGAQALEELYNQILN